MHEVSIALSLLDIVSGECRKGGYIKVESIRLKIGRASGVMPDALVFAFDVVKGDSAASSSATLSIEEIPVGGHCKECNKTFTVEEEYVINCPLCGGSSFQITDGRELDIVDMEVS
jgi:hydrogenase nickel incorporation protein HypA/HybF